VLAGLLQQERLGVDAGLLADGEFGEDRALGGLEDAVETAEDREGEDDLAVLLLLVVAAQEVGDGPDEGGAVGVGHRWRQFAPSAGRHATACRPRVR